MDGRSDDQSPVEGRERIDSLEGFIIKQPGPTGSSSVPGVANNVPPFRFSPHLCSKLTHLGMAVLDLMASLSNYTTMRSWSQLAKFLRMHPRNVGDFEQ